MRTVPPKSLEKLVGFLIPSACREEVLGDLHERFQSTPRYVVDALTTVPLVVLSRIRRTTDAVVFLMEAIVLYSSYLAAAFFLNQNLLTDALGFCRLGLPVAISMLTLMLADAYANPRNRSPLKPMLGPALAAAFAWLSQAVLLAGLADFMLPRSVMVAGSSLGLLLVSSLRFLFAPAANVPAHWQKQSVAPFRISRPNTTVTLAALAIAILLFYVYNVSSRH
jgi:hypothetical protein